MNESLIYESEHTTIEHSYGFRVPGYLFVQPKTSSTRFAELSAAQGADLMASIARAESIITQLIQPERVYALKLGEEDQRIHFHIIPRTAQIEEAYLAAVSDKKPYSGARIVDWIWHNHLSLGYSEDDVSAFIQAARGFMNSSQSSTDSKQQATKGGERS